ncbi:RNA-directed DNA polymerase, eukaryota [Tanacetum coccineum]
MKGEFLGWFGKQIRQRHVDNDLGVSESNELFALACGPSQTPISVNSCVVNGVRFVMHSRDERRTTQSSGICSPSLNGEMYYGQLEQILEFSYLSFKTVLFRVKWFDTSNKGRIQNFVIRNNITQIKANGEAFKNDQYILATQVKQCFYLEDMARRPLGWKVVEHVSHKKFSNRGVIVVEDDPDVIHVDNSSDLALSTSLNDLEIAALHIDGQSIDVDAPPDIIDVVDEDDDIIDEEDPIPHDLADSDDEDLVNLDIDDGVNVMSADVARGHGDDGGGDDRPPPHQIPTGCGGCLGNRGHPKTQFGWQESRQAAYPPGDPEPRGVVVAPPFLALSAAGAEGGGHRKDWAIQQHLQKIYNGMKVALKERLHFGMIPRTLPGLPKINKTGQKARSYADRDPGLLPPSKICM